MSNNCTARNDLLVALHTLASHFENALYAFGDDDEARKKAEGDIAWARLVASRHNYNGSECKEIERLRGEATQLRQALGMLTTLHPTMEIDVNNPMQMAKEIVSYVTESRGTEIERLRQQVTQLGARMQVMREWMMPNDWRHFVVTKPEAAEWFDEDGVPR